MSDHRIEDLIEESVRLVLRSPMPDVEKRPLIADLFEFQAMFDTSDTIGRVEPELVAIGYRGEEDATGRPVLALVAAIIGMADADGRRQMVHHWLAVLVRTMRDLDLDAEAYPRTFAAFRADPQAIAIRDAAIHQKVGGYWDGYIELPTWSEINRCYDKVDPKVGDLRGIFRFLLDHKTDVDAIFAAFEKEQAKAEQRAAVLAQIPDMVSASGEFRYLGQKNQWGNEVFFFEIGEPPEDPQGCRFYLSLKYDAGYDLLFPQIGARSGMIARWQGRTCDADDKVLHFTTPLAAFIPEASQADDKGFNGIGWKWKLSQSARLLSAQIDTITGHWHHTKKFVTFYNKPSLADRLDKEGMALMAKKRRERRISVGYFANEVDMLFALACRRWERGERPEEEIAAIDDWLRHIHPDALFDRVEKLEKLKHGPAFPADVETMPLKRFEQPFEI